MSYSLTDFTESLDRVPLTAPEIDRCVAAWGKSEEGYSEWSGGFVLLLRDGRLVALTGWCDTSGWGCQDHAELKAIDAPRPEHISQDEYARWLRVTSRVAAEAILAHVDGAPAIDDPQWDDYPADINRWLLEHVPAPAI